MTDLTGIGAELRGARESQGLSVNDVAQQLKFHARQIESLEDGRFDRLPGPTIARGMVRNYARLLNVDPEPLLQRMSPAGAAASSANLVGLKQPVPFSDTGRRSTLVYAVFSVAVLALVGVVAYFWQQERGVPRVAETPATPSQPVQAASAPQAAASEAAVEPAKPVETKAPEIPPVAKPKPEAPASRSKPKPDGVAAAPKQEMAPAAGLAAEPKVATGPLHRVVLRCEQDSWLEVKDGAGRSLISSLNTAGSERAVRGRGPLEIVIGNAPGVALYVDDKPVDLKPHTRGTVARVAIP